MLSAGINKLDLTEYSGTGVPLGLSPSGIDVTLGNLPVHSQVCVGGSFGRAYLRTLLRQFQPFFVLFGRYESSNESIEIAFGKMHGSLFQDGIKLGIVANAAHLNEVLAKQGEYGHFLPRRQLEFY